MDLILTLSVFIISLFLILDSLEILLNRKLYGFNSPISTNIYYLNKSITRSEVYFNLIYGLKTLTIFSLIRIFFSTFLCLFIVVGVDLALLICIFALILCELYLRIRSYNRLTSSEYVIFFNLWCFFIYYLFKDDLTLHFISAFIVISYVSNGLRKLNSYIWRKGEGIKNVLLTDIYGNYFLYRFLEHKETIQKLTSWSIILFQMTFPLVFVNEQFFWIYFAIGLIFHLTLAVFMNLRDFLLAFLSSYPILYFTFCEFQLLISEM